MYIQSLTCMLACLALSACATGSAGTVPQSPVDAATLQPHAKSVVYFQLKNDSNETIKFKTYYSYPLLPWVNAELECVKQSSTWNTRIDFNHANPEVRVVAIKVPPHECYARDLGDATVTFSRPNFVNGALTLNGDVADHHGLLKLCFEKYHCQKF